MHIQGAVPSIYLRTRIKTHASMVVSENLGYLSEGPKSKGYGIFGVYIGPPLFMATTTCAYKL